MNLTNIILNKRNKLKNVYFLQLKLRNSLKSQDQSLLWGRREYVDTGRRNRVSGLLEISCAGWYIGVVHLSVVMICFNKNFWTLQKMGLYIRRLCIYLRRFIFSVYLCFTLSRTITCKTWSEMFICHHSLLPNLLCTFSFPCSS